MRSQKIPALSKPLPCTFFLQGACLTDFGPGSPLPCTLCSPLSLHPMGVKCHHCTNFSPLDLYIYRALFSTTLSLINLYIHLNCTGQIFNHLIPQNDLNKVLNKCFLYYLSRSIHIPVRRRKMQGFFIVNSCFQWVATWLLDSQTLEWVIEMPHTKRAPWQAPWYSHFFQNRQCSGGLWS